MSVLRCPACGAENSDLNPHCEACGAALPEDSLAKRPIEATAVEGRGAPDRMVDTLAVAPAPPRRAAATAASSLYAPSPLGDTISGAHVDLSRDARLGRFVVGEELGRGAMGVVVSARDPSLDRTVAIKVLAPETLLQTDAVEARARLLREAKAMARVSHRNVVTVHEVDVLDGQVLIVMERIDGRSLRAWLGEERRSVEKILDVFLQAGRGLAEVHRAGLVHRDFKPDNVLVGEDGRACVTDFGLVGLTRAAAEPEEAARDHDGSPPIFALTSAGLLVGTPAYMAPEQHERGAADARADQFAFCVALHEALYGERPFAGETYEDLRANVVLGRIRPPRAGAGVPAWLRRVLVRGLRVNREERYPSMLHLLADLERDPRAGRRRALAGAAVAALAAAAIFGLARRPSPAADLCKGGAEKLAGVWDEPTRAKVESAFLGTNRPYAEDTYRRVEGILNERSAAWAAMYKDSCEATHVRGEQSAQMLDARTGCLERRRSEMAALTALLARGPDEGALHRAVEAARALPRVDACAPRASLLTAVPLPDDPSAPPRIAAVRARLAEATALQTTGRYKEGLGVATAAEADARPLGYAPVEAEALALRGALERDTGDFRTAEATLRSAAIEAARAKDDPLLALVFIDEIDVLGIKHERYAEALAIEAAALGALERAGGEPALRGRLLVTVAQVLNKKGEPERALTASEAAVELLEKALGPDDPELAHALNLQGNIFYQAQKLDEALARYERSLRIREKVFGPHHRSVASSLNNVAIVHGSRGELEKALAASQRTVAILESVLGPDHPYVADTLTTTALTLTDMGRYDEAIRALRRILAIREKALDPGHPSVAETLNNIGYILAAQDRHADAEPYLARAVAISERAVGPVHAKVAGELDSLGDSLCHQGKIDRGEEHLRRAIGIYEKIGKKDGIGMAGALTSLGECALLARQPGKARPILERALSIRLAREADGDPADIAQTEIALAEALWSSPPDRKRADELSARARDRFAKVGGRYKKDAKRAEAWRRERGLAP